MGTLSKTFACLCTDRLKDGHPLRAHVSHSSLEHASAARRREGESSRGEKAVQSQGWRTRRFERRQGQAQEGHHGHLNGADGAGLGETQTSGCGGCAEGAGDAVKKRDEQPSNSRATEQEPSN